MVPTIYYGPAQEVDWDDRDWDTLVKEHREKLMEQERGAIEQIQKAKKLEQGWVLMRMCRGYIQENSKT